MARRSLPLASIPLVLLALACDAGTKPAADDKPKAASSETTPETELEDTAEPAPATPDPAPAEEAKPTEEPPAADEDPKDDAGGPGPKMPFATKAIEKRAEEIQSKAKTDWIPNKALEGPDTALAVLHLAQTAEDPKLAGAALKALSSQYWGKDHETRRTVDADFVSVVVRRMSSDDPFILEGALDAADMGADVEPPDPTLVAALLDRAKPEQKPEVRELALRAPASVEPLTSDIQQAFLTALDDDDPGMVAVTLAAFKQYTSRFTEREPLTAKLKEMVQSEHAGVRGKALAALTTIDRDPAHREAIAKLAIDMLDDESALVRGEAVYAQEPARAGRRNRHRNRVAQPRDPEFQHRLEVRVREAHRSEEDRRAQLRCRGRGREGVAEGPRREVDSPPMVPATLDDLIDTGETGGMDRLAPSPAAPVTGSIDPAPEQAGHRQKNHRQRSPRLPKRRIQRRADRSPRVRRLRPDLHRPYRGDVLLVL